MRILSLLYYCTVLYCTRSYPLLRYSYSSSTRRPQLQTLFVQEWRPSQSVRSFGDNPVRVLSHTTIPYAMPYVAAVRYLSCWSYVRTVATTVLVQYRDITCIMNFRAPPHVQYTGRFSIRGFIISTVGCMKLLLRILGTIGGSPDGSSPTMWAYGSSGLRIESRRRHTFDLHTPDKAQAGATYEMTNPAHEMRRSTPRLEPVTLTTSRTKIPYLYATGCLSCADRAVIPQRGQ